MIRSHLFNIVEEKLDLKEWVWRALIFYLYLVFFVCADDLNEVRFLYVFLCKIDGADFTFDNILVLLVLFFFVFNFVFDNDNAFFWFWFF